MCVQTEVKGMYLSEGVINNTLFSSNSMRRGKHKLYDVLSDPKKVSATGTQNNTEEA